MLKNYPKVSIMIPTYNQEAYIAQAVESAMMQDYENLEIIIADDCSNDRTGEIAQKYTTDNRVKYFRNKKNLGRVGNYHNTLYKHTSGEWIVNLDGDDYYTDKAFISYMINLIYCHSDKNIVCCYGSELGIKHHYKKIIKYKIGHGAYLFPGMTFFNLFYKIGRFAHLATLFRRDIAIKDGKCYTFQGIISDFHSLIRLCRYGNVVVAKVEGYQWRMHGNNATNNFNDYKIKYLNNIRGYMRILVDMDDALSNYEKRIWFSNMREKAISTYVLDNLYFNHNMHTLRIGLKHFKFNKGYIALYLRALILTIFKH